MDRRTVLGALAGTGFVGLSGCAGVVKRFGASEEGPAVNATGSAPATTGGTAAETTGESGTASGASASHAVDAASGVVANAPVPPDPGRFRYATMGAGGASTTATIVGNWKCPFTRQLVGRTLGPLVRDYVEPGRLRFRFRALAYQDGEPFLGPGAPLATRTGLAVWERDPGRYWPYFATVFHNQPPERVDWATPDRLRTFLAAAGVDDPGAVVSAAADGAHRAAVRATVDWARGLGVETIPRIVVGDAVVAPNREPERTRGVLDEAADDS